MTASRYKDAASRRHETEQEETEMAEREAHDNGICMGIPWCCLCLDEWEESNAKDAS